MMNHELSIFTQYGQFYIADKYAELEHDTSNPNFWNDEAFNDRLAIDNGILGVSIQNDEALANIEIEILESKVTEDDFSNFDHVVEGSLEIKSGKLQIQDCPNSTVELEIDVEPSWYRIRISSLNFEKAYQEDPEDKYIIKIWKENHSERKVFKRWHSS
ncbi:hypothetical protein [Flavobacterium sp.]|uniref:hypothetical protein n=1 Tax=Flavobacterium sp. TaxID=239 RepID=UPI003F6A2910